MFGLLVKVVRKSAVDAGSIPDSSQRSKPPNPILRPAEQCTFPGSIQLLMFLPCEVASGKTHWSRMVSILTRYLAEDQSLLKDIETNAVLLCPVGPVALASLA